MAKNVYVPNYTTRRKEIESVAEIEKILAINGASDIYKEYQSSHCVAVSFAISTDQGKLAFRLPMNVQGLHQHIKNLKEQGELRHISKHKATDINHTRKVGWAIILDWVQAQMPLINAEMVTIEQVFLPYVYNPATDKTLFEELQERNGLPLLEAPK